MFFTLRNSTERKGETMNRLERLLSGAQNIRRETSNRIKKYTPAVPILLILTGLVFTFTAQAQGADPFRFSLVATSATCDSRAWDLASRQESNGQREPGWRLTLENGASQRRIISDRLSGHQRGLATRSGLQ